MKLWRLTLMTLMATGAALFTASQPVHAQSFCWTVCMQNCPYGSSEYCLGWCASSGSGGGCQPGNYTDGVMWECCELYFEYPACPC